MLSDMNKHKTLHPIPLQFLDALYPFFVFIELSNNFVLLSRNKH
jgi:hypothetical protein